MRYLGYFVLGLGLNLTPCVYPMLTITLSLFRGTETENHWRSFTKALLYVVGIAVMFTSVGVTAALSGEFFGSLLQSSWVLIALGIFIITLSLSMFGLYTFRLPLWLIPQRGMSGKTLVEFFLSGLLVGVVASPCMGPVILSLVANVSREGDPAQASLSFFILALGMGFPYLVLGTFSGLLKKLPKSGAWLIWFERLLGVVLFAFGCFYLIIALRWPLIDWLVPVSVLAGGIYLGWIEKTANESPRFLAFKRIAGTAASVAGMVLLFGLISLHPAGGMKWEKFRAGILEEAKAAGQPVVLDFYADWCIPCHELDKYTYSNPKVVKALERFRRIKIDATYLDDEASKRLIANFNVYGVPTVLFLGPDGAEIKNMQLDGFVEADELLAMLKTSSLKKFISPEEGSET